MPRRRARERLFAERVGDFPSFVPVERHLASSTQNQKLAALKHLYVVVSRQLSFRRDWSGRSLKFSSTVWRQG